MAKSHILKCRLSKSQFEDLQARARSLGYVRLAPFLRDQLFRRPDFLEHKIIEIDRSLKQVLEDRKNE